ASIIRPVVKRSFQPTRVDMLPLALRQAASLMVSGRPGPVNVDIPFNVFQEEDEVELPSPAPPLHTHRGGAAPEEIAAAVAMIRAAKRPVLFVGHGVTLSEAGRELTELVHRSGIPVISSPNGMGCLDMTDPLSLGFIGRNAAHPANEAGLRAALVIATGARFDDRSASPGSPAIRGISRTRSSSTSMSTRTNSAATILPISACSPMRALSCASCSLNSSV